MSSSLVLVVVARRTRRERHLQRCLLQRIWGTKPTMKVDIDRSTSFTSHSDSPTTAVARGSRRGLLYWGRIRPNHPTSTFYQLIRIPIPIPTRAFVRPLGTVSMSRTMYQPSQEHCGFRKRRLRRPHHSRPPGTHCYRAYMSPVLSYNRPNHDSTIGAEPIIDREHFPGA